jgi:hypothetical protein
MVRDVGFIGLSTRCRSGWAGMVATRGSYRLGGARSWPSLRPVPLESLARARSSPSSRVHVPGPFTVRGCPAVTGGLDGELARLQDRGTGGMDPSCNAVHQRWTYGAAFIWAVMGVRGELGYCCGSVRPEAAGRDVPVPSRCKPDSRLSIRVVEVGQALIRVVEGRQKVDLVAALGCCTTHPSGLSYLTSQQCDRGRPDSLVTT